MLCVLTVIMGALMLPGIGGFPPFPWGTGVATAQQRVHIDSIDTIGPTSRYRTEPIRLGNAEVDECIFEFTDNRFAGVTLRTFGAENTRQLLGYLSRRFGAPLDSGPLAWQWMEGDTYVSLDEDSDGGGYVLWYGITWQKEF